MKKGYSIRDIIKDIPQKKEMIKTLQSYKVNSSASKPFKRDK